MKTAMNIILISIFLTAAWALETMKSSARGYAVTQPANAEELLPPVFCEHDFGDGGFRPDGTEEDFTAGIQARGNCITLTFMDSYFVPSSPPVTALATTHHHNQRAILDPELPTPLARHEALAGKIVCKDNFGAVWYDSDGVPVYFVPGTDCQMMELPGQPSVPTSARITTAAATPYSHLSTSSPALQTKYA